MKFANHLLLFCLFCLLSLNAPAQDDPFGSSGSKTSSDPFADSSDQAGDDPFAPQPKSSGLGVLGGQSTKPAAVTIDRHVVSERIRKVLGYSTSQSFDETPLVEAVRELRETHDIPMVVDGRALEEIGLSEEEQITIALNRVSLGSFLRLMLRELDLTYMIQDEVLLITTQEAAVQDLIVRAYPMNSSLSGNSKEVAALIQTTVDPSAWTEQGGYATAVPVLGNVVVVAATETLHEKIEDLLKKLDKALGE